jgi:hypothetical protein
LILARTARGYAEAVDSNSFLSPMLRHLLILLDGKSSLKQLVSRYHHGDIQVAASLLWQHGYATPVESAPKTSLFGRMFGRPATSGPEFEDTLQSIFPGASAEAKARFSESGRYWFSLGGLALTEEQRRAKQALDQAGEAPRTAQPGSKDDSSA